MKQRLIYLLSILFTIAVILWILVLSRTVFAKQEPIQEILNQIQMNESELQQIETRADELNKANEEAKSRLLNEYWLQISEEKQAQWLLLEDENWNCIWWIGCEPDERYAWKITEDGSHQEMPEITWADSHERFKELSSKYWLDASMIWNIENHYWIKEWVILCITVAETSWCKNWAWEWNCWNVWNNDRWDRQSFATIQTSIEKIWMTLNNWLLWKKQTLWCLSNRNHCQESWDNWKRYATSSPWIWHREPNMVACLEQIYWKWTIDPATFSIRR